jgi:hypothetical protein
MNIFRFALTAILASASIGYVSARSTGSGGCKVGEASVGNAHKGTKTITTGSLEFGGFSVTIDGQTPIDNKSTTKNLNFDVVVTADAPAFFKGIMFRVGNTTSDQVIPGDDLQVATVCNGEYGSATHTNANEKISGTATIDLDGSETLEIDITIVVLNNGTTSIYYYSGYEVIVQPDEDEDSCRKGLFGLVCK